MMFVLASAEVGDVSEQSSFFYLAGSKTRILIMHSFEKNRKTMSVPRFFFRVSMTEQLSGVVKKLAY